MSTTLRNPGKTTLDSHQASLLARSNSTFNVLHQRPPLVATACPHNHGTKTASIVICRFTTFESGLACLVSLLLHWGHQRFRAFLRWRRHQRKELQQPLLEKETQDTQPDPSQERKTWKQLSVLAWPGALNMLSIIVQGMGLQYISASVSQMISGASPPLWRT